MKLLTDHAGLIFLCFLLHDRIVKVGIKLYSESFYLLYSGALGLDYKDGMYTVNEFIALTKDAYGGEVIKKLIQ